MKKMNIKGGRPIYGKVMLSGDPYAAVYIVCKLIQVGKSIKVTNIPRVKFVLDFFDFIRSLGVGINWVNEDSIKINISDALQNDLTLTNFKYSIIYQYLMVPVILASRNSVVVDLELENQGDFYETLGLQFNIDVKKLSLSKSANTFSGNIEKRINTLESLEYISASRLMFEFLDKGLNIIYRDSNNNLRNLNSKKEYFEELSEIKVPYNQKEFNFFASFGAISVNEIIIENYDLSESLQYLMVFDEIFGFYEVFNENLKLWSEGKELKSVYDLSSLEIDALGYVLILLSLKSKKKIQVIANYWKEIDLIVKSLNIYGLKLASQKRGNKSVLTIRPAGHLMNVRADIANSQWGGILLYIACIANGSNSIEGINELSDIIPYLSENLSNLHIDNNLSNGAK